LRTKPPVPAVTSPRLRLTTGVQAARETPAEESIPAIDHPKTTALNALMDALKLTRDKTEVGVIPTKDPRRGLQQFRKYAEGEIPSRYAEPGVAGVSESRALIDKARSLINSLNAAELGVAESVVAQIKSHYFLELNSLYPYFTQLVNAPILAKEGKKGPWTSTCNITSLAMVLTALGVGPSDFKSSERELLGKIGKELVPDREDFDDLASLRMPDFLQVVAALQQYGHLGGKNFKKRVETARKLAYSEKGILRWDNLTEIAGYFGVKVEGQKKGVKTVESFGKHVIPEQKPIKKKLGTIDKKYRAIRKDYSAGKLRKLKKKEREAKKEEWKAKKAEWDEERKPLLEQLADVETKYAKFIAADYKRDVMKEVAPLLDKGGQILLTAPGHYVRLQSIDETGIVIDDPAFGGMNTPVTWEEANKRGYFSHWAVFKK
jgi:hypothetical protein